ncbi:MAG: EAL domain-containing protein [Gammaproteobacteria bacterium]|nr:EAL domain-containing protein [Gammaproteobacteria bacterium]
MWQKLSIRNQLILLIALLLVIVELTTFSLITWFDHQERRSIAVEQANTLGRSLNNDLLRALISPEADIYSDIDFRISGFKSVDALILFNENNEAILSYGDIDYTNELKGKQLLLDQSWFSDKNRLFLKIPVQADNFSYGQALIIINPEQYQTRLQDHITTLLVIFPLLLGVGLLIAWKISWLFTRPFSDLASAMKNNNVQNNQYQSITTNAKNEVKSLFDGYNRMISQVKSTTDLLHYRSRHDSLTGLYNRYAIEQEIQDTLQSGAIKDTQHALLSIDLDQFKLINDSVGHTEGDKLLKMVAHHLQHNMPPNMSLGRVGGDDFFLLIKNTSKDDASIFAKQQLEALKDFRFFSDGNAITVSASVGMVLFKPHEYTPEELVKTVDIAFYTAKASGHNKLHIFDADNNESKQISDDINIAGFIKEALQEGPSHFELFAQAIVPLQCENDKISYEVLIRMWDSNEQFMSPDSFLSTAERYNLMVDIDIFVLWTYLETVCEKPEHINKLHSAHINLAGGTLNNPDFQEKVKEAINTFNFPWERLELEITETSAIGNLSQASKFINFCRGKGIGFALDDFGTGMASFEYLKNLPFNVVKIDGSFVRDMLTDPVDHAMIRYTHDISKLRIQETVAEYVETEEDFKELRKIGITYGQGYYLGKPCSLKDWLE